MAKLKLRVKIAFSLIITVLFFLIPEIMLRAYVKMASEKAIALSEWIPNSFKLDILNHSYLEPDPLLYWKLKSKKTGVAVNSLGARGKEFSKAKKPGVFRIVCLGDSCTYGSAIAHDEDTYPDILEKILNSSGNQLLHYEVINAGVPGYSSYQGLMYLQKIIVGWKPDLVTVYFGHNCDYAINRYYLIEPSNKWPLIGRLNDLLEYSYLYNLIKSHLLKLKIYLLTKISKDFPAQYRKKYYDLIKTHYLKMANIATEDGFKIIFLNYPTIAFGEGILGKGSDVDQSIEEASREGGVPLVDIIEALKDNGGKDLLLDTVHPNEAGHRVVAYEIFETLVDTNIISVDNYDIKGLETEMLPQ